jgi:hypothetical protein
MVDYGLKEVTYFGLLQDLVFGRIEPKEFMAQILRLAMQLLAAAQQPVEDFFMRNLSFLRDCLTTGKLSVESIRTPSAGKLCIAEAVYVSCQETNGQTCSVQQAPTDQEAGTQPFHECTKPSSQVTQPKVIQPAISQSKGIPAAIFYPKVIRPAIFQPRVIRPAKISQPRVIRPVISQPKVIRPAIFQPIVIRPAISQPKVIRPAISQPKVIRPVISQPIVIRPAISQPKVIRPAISQNKVIRPAISQPDVIRPAMSQQVPSITDSSPPLHHPQETIEKGQQIRGIFVAMCFESGSQSVT